MSKELLLVVDAVANEKGVPKDVIFEAMEAALASAAKKRYTNEEILARVSIDTHSGEYETFRRWEIVADDVVMESPDWQIRLMDALDENPESEVGQYIEEQIENPEFGRIAAQAAKQVIVQRVREAERAQIVDAYADRVGELITGIVKRVERGNLYIDCAATRKPSFRATRRSRAKPFAPATACAATCTKCVRNRVVRSCSFRARRPNS